MSFIGRMTAQMLPGTPLCRKFVQLILFYIIWVGQRCRRDHIISCHIVLLHHIHRHNDGTDINDPFVQLILFYLLSYHMICFLLLLVMCYVSMFRCPSMTTMCYASSGECRCCRRPLYPTHFISYHFISLSYIISLSHIIHITGRMTAQMLPTTLLCSQGTPTSCPGPRAAQSEKHQSIKNISRFYSDL